MKQGRKKLEEKNPLDNPIYSSFIFAISSEINYPKAISDHLKRNAGNVWNQLNYLYKNNFISFVIVGDEKVFPFEKKIYSINWGKIIEEFIKKIKEKTDILKEYENKNDNSIAKKYFSITSKQLNVIDNLENIEYCKRLQTNSYLLYFLKSFFSEMSNLNNNTETISNIFDYLINFLSFNHIGYSQDLEHELEDRLFKLELRSSILIPDKITEKSMGELKKQLDNPKPFEEVEKEYKTNLDLILKNDSEANDYNTFVNILYFANINPYYNIPLAKANNSIIDTILKKHFQGSSKEKILNKILELREKGKKYSDSLG